MFSQRLFMREGKQMKNPFFFLAGFYKQAKKYESTIKKIEEAGFTTQVFANLVVLAGFCGVCCGPLKFKFTLTCVYFTAEIKARSELSLSPLSIYSISPRLPTRCIFISYRLTKEKIDKEVKLGLLNFLQQI